MPWIETVFSSLVELSGLALVLLAFGGLLSWRCTRTIERLRCIQMTFVALAAVCLLHFFHALPRWNLGWLNVDQQQPVDPGIAIGSTMPGIESQHPLTERFADAERTHDDLPAGSNAQSRPVLAAADNVTMTVRSSQGTDAKSTIATSHQSAGGLTRLALLTVFFAGAAAGLISFGLGVLRLRRLYHTSRPASREIARVLDTITPGRRRHVEIRSSSDIAVPITFGLWRPVIMIPEKLTASAEAIALRYCVAHEWSHIRNYDVAQWWAVQLLQPLVWFQPLYWLLGRELRLCQDQLADCFATDVVSDPVAYAELLVKFAKERRFPRAAAALTMTQGRSKLTRRVLSLLDDNRRLATICRRPIAWALLGVLATIAMVLGTVDFRRARAESPPQTAIKPPATQTDAAKPAAEADASPADLSKEAAKYSAKPGFDIDGDLLPAGSVARLGTKRFRPGGENHGTQLDQLTFSPDGKTLTQVNSDGSLQQWDVESGRLRSQSKISSKEIVRTAASTPDGRLVVVGGQKININWFKLIESATGKELLTFQVAEQRSEKLAISPDGKTIAWGRDNIHIFDVASQKTIITLPFQAAGPTSLTFSPNGNTLAIGMFGKLFLWDWTGNPKLRSIDIVGNKNGQDPVNCVAFSPDGSQVAIGHDDSTGVWLWDVASGERLRIFGLPSVERWNLTSRSIAFSSDGKLLAAAVNEVNRAEGVAVWEVATAKLVHRFEGISMSTALAFSPDTRRLAATSSMFLTLCIWDLETGHALGADLPGHAQAPSSLRFFNDDKRLATAGDDGTIRIWNLADSRQHHVIQPESDAKGLHRSLRGMDVSPDGKFVAGSSLDDSVRIWEIETGREVYHLPGHGTLGGMRVLRFTPDGKQLVSWGDDGRLCRWDVETGKAAQEFSTLGEDAKPAAGVFQRALASSGFSAGLSPDASTLIVPVPPRVGIRLVSVATGKEISKINHETEGITRWALSPDKKYALAATWAQTAPSTHPVVLFSVADGKIVTNYEAAGRGADRIAFSPDGRLVAMAVTDDPCHIELRTVPEMADAGQIEIPSRAGGLEFSSSGKLLAVSVSDGTVLVWDLEHLPPKPKP